MLKLALLLLVLLALAVVLYIRFAPSDPQVWHVDPLTAEKPATPNAFLLRPGTGKYPAPEFAVSATALAAAFDDLVLRERHVTRLAGAPDGLWATYVARTPVMGYPDYVSVKFIPLASDRATVAIFSRARFGYGDRGVNRRRVLGWIKSLSAP